MCDFEAQKNENFSLLPMASRYYNGMKNVFLGPQKAWKAIPDPLRCSRTFLEKNNFSSFFEKFSSQKVPLGEPKWQKMLDLWVVAMKKMENLGRRASYQESL